MQGHTWALLSLTEKWSLLRQFPWQLGFHFGLIILLTFQCVYFTSEEAGFKRMAKMNFANYFLPGGEISGIDQEFTNGATICYDIEKLIKSVKEVVHNYYTIQNKSATYVGYPPHMEEGRIPSPILTYQRFNLPTPDVFARHPPPSLVWDTIHVPVNQTSLGPFDIKSLGYTAVQDLVRVTKSIRVRFSVVFFMVEPSHRTALNVDFGVVWAWDHSGPFTVSLEQSWTYFEPYMTAAVTTGQAASFWIIHILTLVLAVMHQIVATRNLMWDVRWTRAANVHRAVPAANVLMGDARQEWIKRTAESAHVVSPEPSQLSAIAASRYHKCLERFRPNPMLLPIANFRFYFVNTLANVLCLWLVFRSSLDGARTTYLLQDTGSRLLTGGAAFFLWLGLLQWRGAVRQDFAIMKTFRVGAPQVAKVAFGVAPIFFGYTLFGLVYFGFDSTRFGYVTTSMVTLFSLMNGDAIRETFTDLAAFDIVTAQLYLYSFIVFFIYVVCAVFVVIMANAFEQEERSPEPVIMTADGPRFPDSDTLTTPLLRRSVLFRSSVNGPRKDEVFPPTYAAAGLGAINSSSSSANLTTSSDTKQADLARNLDRAFKAAMREVLTEEIARADELAQFAAVNESFQRHLLQALRQTT